MSQFCQMYVNGCHRSEIKKKNRGNSMTNKRKNKNHHGVRIVLISNKTIKETETKSSIPLTSGGVKLISWAQNSPLNFSTGK